jgi:hypothetical protein
VPEPITATLLALAPAKALGTAVGKQLGGRVADLVGLMDAQKRMLGEVGAKLFPPASMTLWALVYETIEPGEQDELEALGTERESVRFSLKLRSGRTLEWKTPPKPRSDASPA